MDILSKQNTSAYEVQRLVEASISVDCKVKGNQFFFYLLDSTAHNHDYSQVVCGWCSYVSSEIQTFYGLAQMLKQYDITQAPGFKQN